MERYKLVLKIIVFITTPIWGPIFLIGETLKSIWILVSEIVDEIK